MNYLVYSEYFPIRSGGNLHTLWKLILRRWLGRCGQGSRTKSKELLAGRAGLERDFVSFQKSRQQNYLPLMMNWVRTAYKLCTTIYILHVVLSF